MPNPRGSFIWYELMTPDAGGAKRFYDAVVGWTIDPDPVASGVNYHMIGRSDGGMAGGLLPIGEQEQAHGARPAWLGYIHAPDVDREVEAVEADGGKVLMPAWDQPGIGRLAMVADPDGAPFYLMDPMPPENDPDATSTVFSVDQPQHFRWNELAAENQERAIQFYTRHYGWRQEGDMDMGPMGKYCFLYQDETMIGAVMPKMPQQSAAAWTFYIGVDDIDRAAAAVTDGGGQIMMGPMEIPGGEYSLDGMDPQGAHFGLVGPRHSKENRNA